MSDTLSSFHPAIRRWFGAKFGAATAVQSQAWPRIANGEHVLITAPTGSGKTLTAFLWALNRFANGDWQAGRTRVLYISPLKALNNDIQRNLLSPLKELSAAGDFPSLTVRTRSGDTPQHKRQQMLRKPPDILITTPESLANLLTTARGRTALQTLETVIFDEVHSLIDNRRGISLFTSAERLVELCGELQRIALSATINPLDDIAHYVAGHNYDGSRRPITIINPEIEKIVSLSICYPPAVREASETGISVWEPMGEHFRNIANNNRSTLFFTNSRAMAEKITLKINQQSPALLAYAHHGSLAKEIRAEVEKRLKQGELRAIVATSSLEMGIDIGALDLVVLLQSPPGIAATLQRIGRAGHRVGEESLGILFPIHAHDFLEAAALSAATQKRDLEPLVPMRGALDVLAQIIVSMCASESWRCDDMYQLLKCAAPYANLSRGQFDLVLELLAGRYIGARVRELQPRIIYDRINNTVEAKKSAVFALYSSGGTIPDRGYYTIRHEASGSKIGELDEEFVWEARIGDTFTLGTQHWQVRQITHNDVLVSHAATTSKAPPFWRAERNNRSHHYSSRIGEFLNSAEHKLAAGQKDQLASHIQAELAFDAEASDKLIDYLQRQRKATRTALPSHKHLLVEFVNSGPGGYRGTDMQRQFVLHNLRGGRVNQPWALALSAAWQDKYSEQPEVHADNDAIIIQTKLQPNPADVLSLVNSTNVDVLLRKSLEGSGFFGTRFRECASRFMLLPRQRFNQRLPLWMSRLQAKKILSATSQYDDFPVMLETWRTCLQDEFEMPALHEFLNDLADGLIDWTAVNTATPSPFASNLAFDQINQYMYADDTPESLGQSSLSDDLIKDTIANAQTRPQITLEIIRQFMAKRQRLHPGYIPADAQEWAEWVKERVLIPESEWLKHDELQSTDQSPLQWNKQATLVELRLGDRRWVCHAETALALINCGLAKGATSKPKKLIEVPDPRNALTFATEILSFYGPLSKPQIKTLLPVAPADLYKHAGILNGCLIDGDNTRYFCDANNFEIILRWQRAARRPVFEPLPEQQLPVFLANWHHFNSHCSEDALLKTVDQLRGYSTNLQTMLSDIFTCRYNDYRDQQLDALLPTADIRWLGTGKQKIAYCFAEDMELLQTPTDTEPPTAIFTDPQASYSYLQIADSLRNTEQSSGAATGAEEANNKFWQHIWDGHISADSLTPLRQGQERNFTVGSSVAARQSRRRLRPTRASWSGNWRLLPTAQSDIDSITEMEDNRERVHLLLERYGCINREITEREGGVFRWRHLFRALRVMELSGEVLQGLFFNNMSGPQFVSPHALTRLQQNSTAPRHFWCNALDPISPCGLGLKSMPLPQRRGQNFLAWYEGKLALVVENYGRRLQVKIEPDDPEIEGVLQVCQHIAQTRGKLSVELINNQPARQSPYLAALSRLLNKRADHKSVYFEC